MNDQYLLFKNKKKSLKIKTKNFKKFYKNCLNKKNMILKIETSDIESSYSGDDLNQDHKVKMIQDIGQILKEAPKEIDSINEDEIELMNNFIEFSIMDDVKN